MTAAIFKYFFLRHGLTQELHIFFIKCIILILDDV
jgi:hypothetical protein